MISYIREGKGHAFILWQVSAKKAVRSIYDASHIEALAFHPSGEYMVVGVMQPVTRVYDVNTGQCFVASNPIHQHQGSVVSVDWSADGKKYVTASLDGSIKVWDGVSSNCITTFAQAHEGAEVSSVQFTRNGELHRLILCSLLRRKS